MASSVFNGSLGSYSDGAYRKILRVPHTQAVVKIYKNRRSITIATYFQSLSSKLSLSALLRWSATNFTPDSASLTSGGYLFISSDSWESEHIKQLSLDSQISPKPRRSSPLDSQISRRSSPLGVRTLTVGFLSTSGRFINKIFGRISVNTLLIHGLIRCVEGFLKCMPNV